MTTDTSTLDVALSLARNGFSVFPCNADGLPLVKFKSESTRKVSEIKARGWWEDDTHRVGINVGRSGKHGLIAVDIDNKNGVNGWNSLEKAGVTLPDTFTYKSRSGKGAHFIYRAPKGVDVTNGVNIPGPKGNALDGVDLRAGDGGMVVYAGGVLSSPPVLAQAPEIAIKVRKPRVNEEITLEQWVNSGLIKGTNAETPLTEDQKQTLNRLFPLHGGGESTLYGAIRAVVEGAISGEARFSLFQYARERHCQFYPDSLQSFHRCWSRVIQEVEGEVTAAMNGKDDPKSRFKDLNTYEELDDEDNLLPYYDVGKLLKGDVQQVTAEIGLRSDGKYLFYKAMVHVLVGDFESGKSRILECLAAEVLNSGGKVLWIDADFNNPLQLLGNLQRLGVDPLVLSNRDYFRIAGNEIETQEQVLAMVEDAKTFQPDLAVVDSVGEIMSIFQADSDNADDYTKVHRAVPAALAAAGACVVMADHLSKSGDSRKFGATGTQAKARAVNGTIYEIKRTSIFTKRGRGQATMTIVKDRPGAVRDSTPLPSGNHRQVAGTFVLDNSVSGPPVCRFEAPGESEGPITLDMGEAHSRELQAVLRKNPMPTSRRQIMSVMGWGNDKSARVLKELNDYLNSEQEEMEEAHV